MYREKYVVTYNGSNSSYIDTVWKLGKMILGVGDENQLCEILANELITMYRCE